MLNQGQEQGCYRIYFYTAKTHTTETLFIFQHAFLVMKTMICLIFNGKRQGESKKDHDLA
jgi:hypothetical protein